ncbi:MAG: OmpH family outer membrane protein [Alphaproteobacteria bacterium]|nr:OmpH family outer membrane protein [Alphaproteobacteria bacterium]
MKRQLLIYITLFSLMFIWQSIELSAQSKFSAPTVKIAIVDVQVILRDALSAKSARSQMDIIARQEQKIIDEEEKKLRKRDQELQQQRSILSSEVFSKKQQKLQIDIRNLQRRSRNLSQSLDKGFRSSMNQIQMILFDELRKLSSEIGVNLIIPRSQIVIAVDDFEITELALKRLNKRLPSIDLKLEKTKPIPGK